MKNSNDTFGNRNRDLLAQCLDQLRHRVPNSKESIIIYFTPFPDSQAVSFVKYLIPKQTSAFVTLPLPGS
jgi:hypothetical protein